jgi:hypothetical protein
MAGLENYPFLTPSVEIKKASLYGVSTRAILSRFSNTAAVEVWWNTSLVVDNRNQTCRGPETGLWEVGEGICL